MSSIGDNHMNASDAGRSRDGDVQINSDLGRRIRHAIRDVPDFPSAGIIFKDVTPLLGNPKLFKEAVFAMARPVLELGITHVAAIESRGFIFGSAIALELGAAFVPVRKAGKLPGACLSESYVLEYRSDTLEIHADALGAAIDERRMAAKPKVLVIDDVLATGGTAAAACRLVERGGGVVQAVSVLIELTSLSGREQLRGTEINSIVVY